MASELQNARWRKSSFSGDSGECVEVASGVPGLVGVRDSKNPGGGVLACIPGEWSAFLAGVKAGRFDG
ncbi:DUF397 domain-containing protein [Sphaerisporangium sp. NPDC004334]